MRKPLFVLTVGRSHIIHTERNDEQKDVASEREIVNSTVVCRNSTLIFCLHCDGYKWVIYGVLVPFSCVVFLKRQPKSESASFPFKSSSIG